MSLRRPLVRLLVAFTLFEAAVAVIPAPRWLAPQLASLLSAAVATGLGYWWGWEEGRGERQI